MTVSMVMVVFVLIPMSANMEVIFVTLTPAVLTSLALTAVPAEKATLEMGDIVKVITESTTETSLIS